MKPLGWLRRRETTGPDVRAAVRVFQAQLAGGVPRREPVVGVDVGARTDAAIRRWREENPGTVVPPG